MKFNQPADWRWRRAKMLAEENRRPSRGQDDKYVRRAWYFARKLQQENVKSNERLHREKPDLYAAWLLYDDNESGLRWIFEASVMADISRQLMADYLNASEDALVIYEMLFFDARDALKHPGCIVANILMPFATHQVSANDKDVFWKAMAYYGGWDLVRTCWEIGHATPAAVDFLDKARKQQTIKNGFDAVHTARINNYNAIEHARLVIEEARQDQEGGGGGGSSLVSQHAQVSLSSLMQAIKVTVIRPGKELPSEETRLQTVDGRPIITLEKAAPRE